MHRLQAVKLVIRLDISFIVVAGYGVLAMGDDSNVGIQQLFVTVHGDKLGEDSHSLEIMIRHDLTIHLLHNVAPLFSRNRLEEIKVIFIVTAHSSIENAISIHSCGSVEGGDIRQRRPTS